MGYILAPLRRLHILKRFRRFSTLSTKKEQKGREQAIAVGQPLDVGELQWTVTNAYRINELSQEGFGQSGKAKTGDFVVVDLRFQNNGNEPAGLTSNSVALLDASGRES